ncbi:MAG: hypothetical protein Kow0010_06250 [Dehalococcoidia bacterium]
MWLEARGGRLAVCGCGGRGFGHTDRPLDRVSAGCIRPLVGLERWQRRAGAGRLDLLQRLARRDATAGARFARSGSPLRAAAGQRNLTLMGLRHLPWQGRPRLSTRRALAILAEEQRHPRVGGAADYRWWARDPVAGRR